MVVELCKKNWKICFKINFLKILQFIFIALFCFYLFSEVTLCVPQNKSILTQSILNNKNFYYYGNINKNYLLENIHFILNNSDVLSTKILKFQPLNKLHHRCDVWQHYHLVNTLNLPYDMNICLEFTHRPFGIPSELDFFSNRDIDNEKRIQYITNTLRVYESSIVQEKLLPIKKIQKCLLYNDLYNKPLLEQFKNAFRNYKN